MRRRPFLHLAAGTLATAGWVGAPDSSSRSGSEPSRSESPGSKHAGSSAADSGAFADSESADASGLRIRGVETPRFVVRLNDLGGDPNGRVTPFSDLAERKRRVVTSALEQPYRTDDPPEWLVRFASATPVIAREETYLRLDHTFPTYRITAEAVAETEVGGKVASYAEYEAAVTREEYVLSNLLGAARREGVELTYVWPALREFFDSYDAVRYRGEVLGVSVEVSDPGPPYELAATEAPVSAAARGPVWNADEAPARTRRLVARAGRAPGAYGFDRAPEGLLDAFGSHEYVHLGGTFYAASVEKRGQVPVSMSAEVRDGRVRLSLRNDGDRDLRISSGPPRPFGVVRCRPKGKGADADTAATGRLLWTDAYAESDRVRTRGREVRGTDDVALTATLAPGESVGESYAVPADLPPGEYVVEDSLGVDGRAGEASDAESENVGDGRSTVRYRVTFSVG